MTLDEYEKYKFYSQDNIQFINVFNIQSQNQKYYYYYIFKSELNGNFHLYIYWNNIR
jgi:hypothetical protein